MSNLASKDLESVAHCFNLISEFGYPIRVSCAWTLAFHTILAVTDPETSTGDEQIGSCVTSEHTYIRRILLAHHASRGNGHPTPGSICSSRSQSIDDRRSFYPFEAQEPVSKRNWMQIRVRYEQDCGVDAWDTQCDAIEQRTRVSRKQRLSDIAMVFSGIAHVADIYWSVRPFANGCSSSVAAI
jgi:hypothetical protein